MSTRRGFLKFLAAAPLVRVAPSSLKKPGESKPEIPDLGEILRLLHSREPAPTVWWDAVPPAGVAWLDHALIQPGRKPHGLASESPVVDRGGVEGGGPGQLVAVLPPLLR